VRVLNWRTSERGVTEPSGAVSVKRVSPKATSGRKNLSAKLASTLMTDLGWASKLVGSR
jgi:hypothetical protein